MVARRRAGRAAKSEAPAGMRAVGGLGRWSGISKEERPVVVRFWRRLKVAPGVTVNLGKLGGTLSFGPRGAKVTVDSRGARATAGLAGTGLFTTQTMPRDEKSFVAGCREVVQGNHEAVLEHLRCAAHLADGAYLAGFLALDLRLLSGAARHLERAAERPAELGRRRQARGDWEKLYAGSPGYRDVAAGLDL